MVGTSHKFGELCNFANRCAVEEYLTSKNLVPTFTCTPNEMQGHTPLYDNKPIWKKQQNTNTCKISTHLQT